MSKYKKQFQLMLEENQELFDQFKILQEDPKKDKDEFNKLGTKVHRVIRRYEDALCSKSENSGFGKFSENLSDKFWNEVRAYFPSIDQVELQ